MRRFFLLAALTVFVLSIALTVRHFGSQAKAAEPFQPAAVKNGWWIKVRTDRTESTSIDFQIGTKREDRESWRTWRSSDAVEFDVPDKYIQVAHLYVGAVCNPQGKHAWFCLMYKDHGVQHFDFDDRHEEDKNQTDSDGDCN